MAPLGAAARAFEQLARALAGLAAVLLFLIGAMLTFEVIARYFFNAPTIWAEELSRLFLIWAVFIGSAALLASGDHIRVTVLVERAPRILRRFFSVVALVFVAVIAGSVAWNGLPSALDSFERGRTTGSMLDLPQWWSQAAVPLGFAMLAVQAVLLALSVIAGGEDPFERPSHTSAD